MRPQRILREERARDQMESLGAKNETLMDLYHPKVHLGLQVDRIRECISAQSYASSTSSNTTTTTDHPCSPPSSRTSLNSRRDGTPAFFTVAVVHESRCLQIGSQRVKCSKVAADSFATHLSYCTNTKNCSTRWEVSTLI